MGDLEKRGVLQFRHFGSEGGDFLHEDWFVEVGGWWGWLFGIATCFLLQVPDCALQGLDNGVLGVSLLNNLEYCCAEDGCYPGSESQEWKGCFDFCGFYFRLSYFDFVSGVGTSGWRG